jgi:hypothetical protein
MQAASAFTGARDCRTVAVGRGHDPGREPAAGLLQMSRRVRPKSWYPNRLWPHAASRAQRIILAKRHTVRLRRNTDARDLRALAKASSPSRASAADAKSAVDETRFDEIVEAIVDELRPYRRPKKDVHELVPRLIKLNLREVDQLWRRLAGTPAEALKHLKEVRETAAKLEKLLLTMPNRVAWVVEMRLGTLGFRDELGLLSPAPVEQPRLKFMSFISDLERLQTAAKIAETYRGPSPLYEVEKGLSAKYARFLIVGLSKRPPTMAPSGPLRTIASLIFEVITGEQDANLERHCKAELRRSRSQPPTKR